MYELINTSVPQGLVAGSHGFATVAMTKGISDVIRNRLENFCAYSHRTRVRDSRYFAENPVNWFHFVLPNGDHVLGRTAPAEFDYTGRTNRLAHVLHFGAREMPQNGGAYVLLAEEDKLSEPWTGSPRYLAEDKLAVGRLRLADDPANREPTHWISLFGAKGVEYARRFARLLNQNIQGTNRGIYFKTTAALDVDGKRLLGLFSDLINLLPDRQLAAQVTFSTFSDCVPAGVVCHLRGIYDRSPAFESVAPFQPWIDCENGIVHHPELLPAEPLSVETKSSVSAVPKDWSVDYPAAQTIAQRTQPQRSPITEEAQSSSGKSDRLLYALLIGCVVVLLACVIGIASMYSSSRAYSARQARIRQAERHSDEIESWYASKMNEISAIRQRFEKSENVFDLNRCLIDLRGIKQKDHPCDDCAICQERWKDIESACQKLEEKIESKKREFEAQEQPKSRQKEVDAKETAGKQVKRAPRRQEECVPLGQEALDKSLKDLTITEVVFAPKDWRDKLSDIEKSKLTNDESIVYFYKGVRERETGKVEEKRTTDLRTVRSQKDFSINPPRESTQSRWLVVYIPDLNRVYWQWNEIKKPEKLFKEKDSVDLDEIVFGGDQEAKELYWRYLQAQKKPLIYTLEYKIKKGNFCHFTTTNSIPIDKYTQDGASQKDVRKRRFKVGVCEAPPEDLFESIKADDKKAAARERWKNFHEIDLILKGVGGN